METILNVITEKYFIQRNFEFHLKPTSQVLTCKMQPSVDICFAENSDDEYRIIGLEKLNVL